MSLSIKNISDATSAATLGTILYKLGFLKKKVNNSYSKFWKEYINEIQVRLWEAEKIDGTEKTSK